MRVRRSDGRHLIFSSKIKRHTAVQRVKLLKSQSQLVAELEIPPKSSVSQSHVFSGISNCLSGSLYKGLAFL